MFATITHIPSLHKILLEITSITSITSFCTLQEPDLTLRPKIASCKEEYSSKKTKQAQLSPAGLAYATEAVLL
jgi:hypothetical protein